MMKKINSRIFACVCNALVNTGAKTAIKYIAPDTVVKATWRLRPDRREKTRAIIISFGSPAYREAKFIKLLKASNESFPVKKIQLRHYTKNKI